jgi:hypothetical protein
MFDASRSTVAVPVPFGLSSTPRRTVDARVDATVNSLSSVCDRLLPSRQMSHALTVVFSVSCDGTGYYNYKYGDPSLIFLCSTLAFVQAQVTVYGPGQIALGFTTTASNAPAATSPAAYTTTQY